jgi:hypothetical protein
MCPAILLFKQKRSSVRRSVATRTSRTTVYVFMPKRNNNSQAAIHKHNNIHFSYLDVPRDLLFKKISVRNGLAHARRRQQFMCSCQNGMIIHRQPSTNIFNIYFSYLDVPCDLLFKTTKKVSVRNVLAHARQRQQFIFSCQNGITIHRQPSTNIKIYTFHTSMSPAICYSKKIKKVSVRNGLAHARQQQQFMFSCQNGITIYKQPSTNIKIYTFHTSMSPAICYSKKIKKVSVRTGVAHARQRQQFMFSCQNGITIHRQPSTNIKIYTSHTSMSPAIFY